MADRPSIAELVARLPATDAEADPNRPAPQGKPSPPSKFTGPDPDESARLAAAVLEGGHAALLELTGLVRDPAGPDFQSYRAEYLLHCIVLHVGQKGKEASRKAVSSALTSALADGSLSRYARGFLLRELQWVGDREAAATLGGLLNDPQLCADAAAALLAIGGQSAAEQFRTAWPKAQAGSSAACREAILHGLAAVLDPASKDILRAALSSSEATLRLTAAWGLAQMADADSAGALLKLADGTSSFERVKAMSACFLLAERLAAAGNRPGAARLYRQLRDARQAADERHVREAAGKALAAIEAERSR